MEKTMTRKYPYYRQTEKALLVADAWLPKSLISFRMTGETVHGGGGVWVPQMEVTMPLWLMKKNDL
jgi:hypothetical protein